MLALSSSHFVDRASVEGKARCKQLCRPFATLSDLRDNACRHPEIKTAFIWGECDMNDTIAIAWHGHKLGVVPITGGIEQRTEKPNNGGELTETRYRADTRGIGARHLNVLPSVLAAFADRFASRPEAPH